jgi:hypothetical protein
MASSMNFERSPFHTLCAQKEREAQRNGRVVRARITRYAEAVERSRRQKRSLTLVIEEELLLAARKVALEQRTSVNQLVREFLSALVREPAHRRLARARLAAAFQRGIVRVGDRSWTRDDLYER